MVKTTLSFCMLTIITGLAYAQGMKIGEALVLSYPALNKDVKAETFQTFITGEVLPVMNKEKPGTSHHLFKSDRGNQKEQFLLVAGIEKIKDGSCVFMYGADKNYAAGSSVLSATSI